MADIDIMPLRGVPSLAQVGPTGIALNGTATVEQLAQRGMRAVCIVDAAGLNAGVTVEQLAQRGIRAACLVDANGLAGGVSADALRARGIKPIVQLTALGLSGAVTIDQLADRGLDYACLVDQAGNDAAVVTPGPEATAFLARTSGLNATHTNAYATLINSLVAAGIWAKLDILHVYATQDTITAKLNLVSASYPAVLQGTGITFTGDSGYDNTPLGGWIDTGFNPTTAPTPKFIQNSCHQMFWNLTNINISSGNFACGAASPFNVVGPLSGSAFRVAMNDGSTTVANADGRGCFIGTRTSSVQVSGHQNGTQTINNGALASTGLVNNNFYVLASNQGSPQAAQYRGAAFGCGGGLTPTDALNYFNSLRTYMTTVGVS